MCLQIDFMENRLVFDVRTDTNDNGGGKVREYRCPARHRVVPYTSIRKSLSSAGHRAGLGLGHVRPHDLRHTFVTRMLDLGVPIEQINYLAGHKSMAMTKRYDHANEERYGAAIEALDAAGSAEALAAARWKQT
jgi:integrase